MSTKFGVRVERPRIHLAPHFAARPQTTTVGYNPRGMSVEAGTRIGVYEVRSRLGEGAMGLVFRAHDTKLQRDVALKVLPEQLAANPDRLARFQREAQLLASLNH